MCALIIVAIVAKLVLGLPSELILLGLITMFIMDRRYKAQLHIKSVTRTIYKIDVD